MDLINKLKACLKTVPRSPALRPLCGTCEDYRYIINPNTTEAEPCPSCCVCGSCGRAIDWLGCQCLDSENAGEWGND
jgi:hypothetical protein